MMMKMIMIMLINPSVVVRHCIQLLAGSRTLYTEQGTNATEPQEIVTHGACRALLLACDFNVMWSAHSRETQSILCILSKQIFPFKNIEDFIVKMTRPIVLFVSFCHIIRNAS